MTRHNVIPNEEVPDADKNKGNAMFEMRGEDRYFHFLGRSLCGRHESDVFKEQRRRRCEGIIDGT